MNGFEERTKKKIKQIFSASFDLVAEYGFNKINVQEIATRANVSPATIYNYFGTKDNLFKSMLNDWIDSKIYEYETILTSDQSFEVKIKEIITMEADNIQFLNRINKIKDRSPVHSFLVSVEEKLEVFFQKLVDTGKMEGYISKHLSDRVLLTHFQLFFHEIAHHINDHTNQNKEEETSQLLQLFFYGLSSCKLSGSPSS
ncbi:transcriptional regulator, TetR family [Gracilibacillus orientalis]|uniref:Transcriptional regulator, TetR family n=1 Tax=Gracilibacillus orientalis TaxID=334253 RepID=A0A1I4K3Z5_9BACI|nr:TetR/AcrR family transcriptional regulator [Gracilibacillus orientalis]SFL73520.1 transcriptional regulator, TetR family [Gracilibacillus orientalis]